MTHLGTEDLRKKAWHLVHAKAEGHLMDAGLAELIDEMADVLARSPGWQPSDAEVPWGDPWPCADDTDRYAVHTVRYRTC